LAERLESLWEDLRSHLLFIPGVLVVLGIILAVVLVEVDRRLVEPETIRGVPWLFGGGAPGARGVLSTIASAMAQLAGITFSVTIVALALRSQQFGPRLLRHFTRDKGNQIVLGTFLATFVYALLVLRSVRGLDDAEFVPLLAVTGAIILALMSLAAFIFFIDKVVDSIQATSIIASVAEEAHAAIETLFPEQVGEEEDEPEAEDYPTFVSAAEVLAPETGYIQDVDAEKLLELTREAGIILRMEAPIGGFVVKGTPLAMAMPSVQLSGELKRELQRAYRIGRHRSITKDPEFGFRQIVDVAVKALSPSMNDPTTAVTCLEFLGALLIDLSSRSAPSRLRYDEEGHLRVIALGTSFPGMVRLAFDQIQEHGHEDVAVTVALLETLIRVGRAVRAPVRRQALEAQVWKVARGANGSIADPTDRERINRLLQLAMERVGGGERGAAHYLLPLQKAG
jgi:uncharacterized membrane protein